MQPYFWTVQPYFSLNPLPSLTIKNHSAIHFAGPHVIICSSVDSGWIPKVFVLLSYFYLYLLVLFPKFSGPNEVFYSCCFTCSSLHYTLGNMDKNAHWEKRACSDSLAARDQSWSFRNSHPFSSRAPPPISSSLCHWRVSELGPGTDSGKWANLRKRKETLCYNLVNFFQLHTFSSTKWGQK